MSHAIILGSGSDIGREITRHLRDDGWVVTEVRHDDFPPTPWPPARWDLVVCCYGMLEPIGSFWSTTSQHWQRAFDVNLFTPLHHVRHLHGYHNPGASVCFFSGAGTSGPAPTYSAYAAAKVALVKMAELLDDESEDCKFFILGPGVVNTKIHDQTLAAGPDRASNYDRVAQIVATGRPGTSYDDIYACLMACHCASKHAVGGRNIYVPGDDWSRLEELAADRGMFKLRRAKDGGLRRK